ncbi:MAG: AI-2E family transporter [Chthoniobacterales bacterium]
MLEEEIKMPKITWQERRRQAIESQGHLLSVALWTALILGSFYVLHQGRSLVVPFLLALIAVYLIFLLSRWIQTLSFGVFRLPRSLAMIIAFGVIFGLGYILFSIVADNALAVANETPRYQARLLNIQRALFAEFNIKEPDALRTFFSSLDLRSLFTSMATNLASLLGSTTLVFIYSLFLAFEIRHIPAKINALFPNTQRREKLKKIISRIDRDINTYLGVKTLISLTTGLLSYGVMRVVGLEFAEFWALLIFVLNFIPTVGSIISTLLPTMFALVQFENSFTPFFIIGISILAIQQILGTIIEPNLVGGSLNVSPLVVIMSLILWGTILGIVGAFLCVPITVILLIILSNFESTRWVAVLLSKNGQMRFGQDVD